jgi:type VI protein secretion system component VasK
MATSTSGSERYGGHRWRPWLSTIALVLAVWAVVAAHWLAFPGSAAPTAGQSGAVAIVAGLLVAALLRLWDAWDQLRAERRATDASLERLDSALWRAEPPDRAAPEEPDLDARVEYLRKEFRREQEQLRELRATDGFGAAWRAGFGPGAPDPDQLIEQLDALLDPEDERKQP